MSDNWFCNHKFSDPFSYPAGLARQCRICGEIKDVDWGREKDVWLNKPSEGTEWKKQRLKELIDQNTNGVKS